MPTDCRREAAFPEGMPIRCRTMPIGQGRLRACSARSFAITGPGGPVAERSRAQGQCLARRDQQDRNRRTARPLRISRPVSTRYPNWTHGRRLTRLWSHLKKSLKQRAYGWFERWTDIEAEATALRSYEPLVVPGLLQTEDYARAILSARPDGNLDDLDEQVAARLARQAVLERASAPQLWCVLDEGVLDRAIGGSKVMRSQLYRLADLAEHPKTTIQVIQAGGAHAGLLGGFVIADLDGKPPMVYLETAAEGQVTDSPSVVAHLALRFDRLRAEALPWAASRDLIRRMAEEQWT